MGQVMVVAAPGEFTTMAGRWLALARKVSRRLREAVAEATPLEGGVVVLAGLSNMYTHYITTWEVGCGMVR